MAIEDHGGRSYLPRTRKTRALLAILALASPKPVLRLSIASLLWSRREKEQARASLRQCVHELQDILGYGWCHLFVADRHNLTFRGPALRIDTAALTQPAHHDHHLFDLFRDTLLEDLNGLDPAFDQWLDEERARLGRIGRTIAEGMLAGSQELPTTLAVAEQLLLIDRTHEGAWRAIIRAHAERGDRGMAASAYEHCRAVLAETSFGKPSPETEDLIARIPREASAAIPPPPCTVKGGATAPDCACVSRRSACWATARMTDLRSDWLKKSRPGSRGSAGFPASPRRCGRPLAGRPRPACLAWMRTLCWTARSSVPAAACASSCRLMDLRAGGEIVWAGRFDREMTDPSALQDELGAAIVAQVDPELMQHEGRRTVGASANELTAQDLLLQALPGMYRMERAGLPACATAAGGLPAG